MPFRVARRQEDGVLHFFSRQRATFTDDWPNPYKNGGTDAPYCSFRLLVGKFATFQVVTIGTVRVESKKSILGSVWRQHQESIERRRAEC